MQEYSGGREYQQDHNGKGSNSGECPQTVNVVPEDKVKGIERKRQFPRQKLAPFFVEAVRVTSPRHRQPFIKFIVVAL